ncbi:alpha/beta hydrolase fold domain-containing protein [Treponema sp.]|uniref:alpha/beta hydrolase fold domain-containing protein n=1 Tax=Treponema sp. TaxID=166 RepID=UPI003890CE4B
MEIRLDRKTALKKVKTLVLSSRAEVENFRIKLEKNFRTDFLPNRVERSEKSYFGVKCDLLAPEVFASSRIVVYIHGGSFVGGSRESWRGFCSSFAHAVSSRVIVPEFRLAPSYQYPSSIEDIECVMRGIIAEANAAQISDENAPAPEIILAADGSGASLAFSVLFRMDEEKRKSISKLVLFSPWLDLSFDNPIYAEKKSRDKVLNPRDIRYAAELYTAASNLSSIHVSPLKASESNFVNFPEVFIQSGENEILLSQAEQMNDLLTCHGIDCTLDVVPEMFYMFQMAGDTLLESSFAVERAGKYVNKRADLTDKELVERERLIKENNITRE